MALDLFTILLGTFLMGLGAVLGYYARQSIAKKKAGTIERQLHEKIQKSKAEAQKIIEEAKAKAYKILERAKKEEAQKREELLKVERALLNRSSLLEEKAVILSKREEELKSKEKTLQNLEKDLSVKKEKIEQELEKIAGLTKDQAKELLLERAEKETKMDILARLRKLEAEGEERFQRRAKEILATVIQKLAVPQTQELTTTTVLLPSEEMKGRIIGKEGRNIRTLERLTGVEILLDENPEVVVLSSYDPVRRHIAKIALERLIADGRIQPARIEEEVKKAEQELEEQMLQAGESAAFEAGVVGLDSKLLKILGRLKFRTSYGQNVLLHSIETALLAGALASELGADVRVAKTAGLLHDIGKALDHKVEGSHVEIGIKILEKFGVDEEVIKAMRAHHDEYPTETLEAVIVKVADAISGSRPGARKDTLENYLKRIEDLEKLALRFEGVEKAWALQAGREIRVFVKPEEISDEEAEILAKKIAKSIEEELRYPGEIKVTLIREKRVIEYAR